MKEFRQIHRILNSYLEACREADEAEPCQVLDQMDPKAGAPGQ